MLLPPLPMPSTQLRHLNKCEMLPGQKGKVLIGCVCLHGLAHFLPVLPRSSNIQSHFKCLYMCCSLHLKSVFVFFLNLMNFYSSDFCFITTSLSHNSVDISWIMLSYHRIQYKFKNNNNNNRQLQLYSIFASNLSLPKQANLFFPLVYLKFRCSPQPLF